MKIPGALLFTGVVLFILSMNLPLRFGRAGDWLYFASLACVAGGSLWGLIRGPAGVRLAVALSTASLVLFVVAMMVVPMTMGGGPRPMPLIYFPEMNATIAAIAAILLILAVIQGIRVSLAERPADRTPSVR
jgi:hypothetical protein